MITFFKQAFWTSLNVNLTTILNFFGIIILARILSPETFGIYVFYVATKEIIANFCSPSLTQTFLYSSGNKINFINVCKLNFFFSIIILIVSIFCSIIFKIFNNDQFYYILIIFGFVTIINNFASIFLSTLEKRMNFKKASIIRSFSTSLGLILTIIIAVIYKDNIHVLVFKEIIMSFFLFIISYKYILSYSVSSTDTAVKSKNDLKELLTYSFRSYFPKLTETLSYKIFDILVSQIYGKYLLALFYQSINIIRIPYKFIGSVTDNLLFVYVKDEKENNNKIREFYQLQLLILLFMIPFVIIFHKYSFIIVDTLLGNQWVEMSNALGNMGMFLIILPLHNSLVTIYQAYDNQRYYTISNCLIVIIQIFLLNFFEINLNNLINSFCFSFYFATLFLGYNLKINQDFNKTSQNKILILISVIFFSFLAFSIYKNNVLLILIFVIWILIFKNQFIFIKKILNIFKKKINDKIINSKK